METEDIPGLEKIYSALLKPAVKGLVYPDAFNFRMEDRRWDILHKIACNASIETLLYFRLREKQGHNCPSMLFERLKNRFESAFAHAARLNNEADLIFTSLKDSGIKTASIKGYPLSLKYYPHIASRTMQDIDLCCSENDFEKISIIFQQHSYSILPPQSKLEKKTNFVKLHATYIFAFELHRNLYTSYLENTPPLPPEFFDTSGFPPPEYLFLSVLLHHKYFECSIRDIIDLEFIFSRYPGLDFRLIENFCAGTNLKNHLFITARMAKHVLDSEWPDNFLKSGFKTGVLKNTAYKIKLAKGLFRPGKRAVFDKILDAVIMLFIYDNFIIALTCFINKYILFVRPARYWQAIK